MFALAVARRAAREYSEQQTAYARRELFQELARWLLTELACEVYGVVNGLRFVGRRASNSREWHVTLERRPQPVGACAVNGVERLT